MAPAPVKRSVSIFVHDAEAATRVPDELHEVCCVPTDRLLSEAVIHTGSPVRITKRHFLIHGNLWQTSRAWRQAAALYRTTSMQDRYSGRWQENEETRLKHDEEEPSQQAEMPRGGEAPGIYISNAAAIAVQDERDSAPVAQISAAVGFAREAGG